MQKQLAVFIAMIVVAGGITAGLSAVLITSQDSYAGQDAMPAFSNYAEMSQFMDSADLSGYGGGSLMFRHPSSGDQQLSYGGESSDYSKTNVRTEGVDEEDTVKTDGEYIYSAEWNSVRIIKAYPPNDVSIVSYVNETELISKLADTKLEPKYDNYSLSASISGIFVTPGRLIIMASVYQWYNYSYDQTVGFYPYSSSGTERASTSYMPWTPDMQTTVVFIFNVEDASSPTFETLYASTGYPLTSRLQDGFLYSMSQTTIWKSMDGVYETPEITESGKSYAMDVTDIHYDPETESPSSYLTITAIDLATGNIKTKAIVGDSSSTIYKSLDSMFITFVKWTYMVIPMPLADQSSSQSDIVTTTIYKVVVNGLSMHISARGDVSGVLHDQFSMDEKDGYLRVALNNGDWEHRLNSICVLDSDLVVVGAIENLAANESIQAARFVGDTLYLVTFRQIDPLFVIDLSDPTEPKVFGELTMPGFSSYLHPVDEDHVLGIGREGSRVKISLYDVSDPTNPQEASKYLTEENWYAYSSAEWDYKAVLFSAEKNLLVIPVTTYNYSSVGSTSISGFFVFDVSVDLGISLRGIVSHDNYYSYGGRSLYIGEYLYTITDSMMKVSALSDLSEVARLELPSSNGYYYTYETRGVDALAE